MDGLPDERFVVLHNLEDHPGTAQPLRDLRSCKPGAKIGALHPVENVAKPPRLIEKFVISSEGGTESAPGIPGGRLNPKVVDHSAAQNLAVGDTIERDAASQAKPTQAGFRNQAPNHAYNRLVEHRFDRGSEIDVTLLKQFVWGARWPAEQTIKAAVGHPQPDAIVEVFLIEMKGSVGFEVDQMLEDGIGVSGLAIRRQSHNLVLAGIHLEAGVVGEGRVKQAKRVREMDFLAHLDAVISANPDARGGPLSNTVHCEDQRLLERRRIESAGRVALVMLGEQQLVLPVEVGRPRFAQHAKKVLLQQFLLEPHWQSHAERGKPPRREGEIGLEQPFELDKRLLVKNDVIELVESQAALVETIANGKLGIARVLLFAGKPLFLRRSNDMTVLDQRRSTVVIKGRDPENAHPATPFSSKQRVDERRDRRALGCYQQRTEQRHSYHNRGEPKFLTNAQEGPDLADKADHQIPLRTVASYSMPRPPAAHARASKWLQSDPVRGAMVVCPLSASQTPSG